MSKRIITVIIIFLFFLSPCTKKKEELKGSEQQPENLTPAFGDKIIVSSIGDASNLIPMLSSDSASHDIAGLIFNGLIKYDKDLNIVGDLAESWEISNDCLKIIFHLRKGVKWQDGVEFTADDVVFGYETIKNPNTPTSYFSLFDQVEEVKAKDKYTLEITYNIPYAPGLSSWDNLMVLPKHLLEGKDITKSELTRKPIGTGPYKFVEWKTGERIVLEAYDNYFEGRPYIDKYIYRIIPDQATIFLELKSEQVDWAGLTPIQYTRLTDTEKFRQTFNKYRYPSFSYTYLGYNLQNTMFQDKRVRQAISYAIDKNEIIEGVQMGLGIIATGPIQPGTWAYNPNVKSYQYNPEMAKNLLKEVGWEDTNGDGIIDKDGKPFQFTILTNQGNDARAKTGEIIQKRLKDVGIEVKIRILEWAAFINDFIDKKNFEAIILGWTVSLEPDPYLIWHSSKTKFKEFNFISYINSEVDELVLKARQSCNIDERKKYLFRFQEVMAEDQPYTFLYVPDALPVIHKRFKGIEPAPAGIAYNFHKWYVPEQLQKY